ncbi:hypothetical protein HDV05_006002 [Chytridiales sp. JEL 0842]|nr:hypothetical protein HDV05_006002 [Chytridiales sp. JEL 0842]
MGSPTASEREPLLGTKKDGVEYPSKESPQQSRTSSATKAILAFAIFLVGYLSFTQLRLAQSELKLSTVSDYLSSFFLDDTASFKCSGHGVVVTGNNCLCDLGYTGSQCTDLVGEYTCPKLKRLNTPSTFLLPIPNIAPTTEVYTDAICFVTEQFGSLGDKGDGRAASTAELAASLTKAGYSVTVLYVGPENSQFSKVASSYESQNINLVRLPQTGLNHGSASIEATSYSVYQYLIGMSAKFSHVYFSASSGSGYYTLLAQSQGLLCSKTSYIVGVDRLPRGVAERIESGDSAYMPVTAETLKSDYLMRKSVELADVTVYSSNAIFEAVKSEGWAINNKEKKIIPNVPSVRVVRGVTPSSARVTEVVFVGPLNIGGGLKEFADALDLISESLAKSNVKVTFLGPMSTINEMASDEYLELRAQKWESGNLKWSIKNVQDPQAAVDYMNLKNTEKIAVIPSLNDVTGSFGQAMLYSGVKFIGSSKSAIKELVNLSSKSVIVTPEGSKIATKISESLDGSLMLASPKVDPRTSVSTLVDLLEKPKQVSCRNSAYESLAVKPLVSIVVVHHNRHKLLKQTLESIEAQTYKNIEVILVDDGSTDAESIKYLDELSWTWWQEKGWKVIRESNRYLGASRNTGVKNAVGKYIVFLDDDDYSKPHQIETLIKVAINTGAEVVTAGHDTFSGLKRPTSGRSNSRYIPIGPDSLTGMLENVFGDSAMLVKKDYFVDIGGFTEDYGVGFEDYEFLAKTILKGHRVESVPESLHWYRRHSNTMSSSTNLKTNQLRMMRPYLEAEAHFSENHKALLENTKRQFFEKYSISFDQDPFLRRSVNQTTTVVSTPTGPSGPGAQKLCMGYLDQTGQSAVEYSSLQAFYQDRESWCWNFGTRSIISEDYQVRSNPILMPVYPNGTSAGFPIISAMPCNPGYSDVGVLVEVVVNATTAFNQDYDTLKSIALEGAITPKGLYNYPIVYPGSTIKNGSPASGIAPPLILQGWYQNKRAFFADLGEVPNTTPYSFNVPTFDVVEISSRNAKVGRAVLEAGNKDGTGFYMVNNLDMTPYISYKPDSFRSFEDFSSPYIPIKTNKALNCPVFFSRTAAKVPFTSFRGMDPSIVPTTDGVKIALRGSNFQASTKVYLDGKPLEQSRVTVATSEFIFVNLDLSSFYGTDGSISVYADDSVPYDLQYYDSRSLLSGVTSDTLYTKVSSQKLSISGDTLKRFPSAVCIFNVTGTGVATPFYVSSPNTAECNLPVTQKSQVVSVDVAYSTPKFDVPENQFDIPTSKGVLYRSSVLLPTLRSRSSFLSPKVYQPISGLSVIVYAQGPKVASAQFSSTGTSIYVTLDKPAIIISDSSSVMTCDKIFSATSEDSVTAEIGKLARAGFPTDCTVQQLSPAHLKLVLKGAFTSVDPDAVKVDDLIVVQKSTLKALGEQFSMTTSSASTVNAPADPQKPMIKVRAPQLIPACADLDIDLSSSTGSGGRSFVRTKSAISFKSSTFKAHSSIQSQNLMSSLMTGLSGFTNAAGPSVLIVPSSLMWKPSDPSLQFEKFDFQVNLTNFLDGRSSKGFSIMRASDDSVPYLIFDGVDLDHVHVNKQNAIIAAAKPVCGIRTPVEFRWKIGPDGCPNLSIPNDGSSTLVIPPFTLAPMTFCDLVLQAKYVDHPKWYDFDVSFFTEDEGLHVSSGSSRTVGLGQKNVVDAIVSDDSQPLPLDMRKYSCEWTCQFRGESCSNVLMGALKGCTGNDLTGLFAEAGVYTLNVEVTSKITGATSEGVFPTQITIVEDVVPVVAIVPNQVQTSADSEIFLMKAVVDSKSVKSQDLTYTWGPCGADAVLYTAFNFTNPSNFVVDLEKSPKVLKFARGALKAESIYCFAVTVTDSSTKKTGVARYVFEVTEAPSGGHCFLDVAPGGLVTYNCKFWVSATAAAPLSYTFFARPKGASTWSTITAPSHTAFIKSTFAPGTYEIRAEIVDAVGSKVSEDITEFTVAKTPSKRAVTAGCSSEVCQKVNDARSDFEITKNIVEAAKVLGSASIGLSSSGPELAIALEFAQKLIAQTPIDTQIYGPYLASLLQSFTVSGYTLDSFTAANVTTLLQAVANGITQSGKLLSPRGCVSQESTADLFSTIDKVLGSVATKGVGQSEVIDKINQVITEIDKCVTRKLVAEERPVVTKSAFFSRTIGVADKASESQYCSFEVKGENINTSQGSVAYSCGGRKAANYPSDTSLSALNPDVVDLVFYDPAAETSLSVSDTTFAVKLAKEFDDKYKLTGYTPIENNGVNTTVNSYDLFKFQPLCVFYDKSSPTNPWSSEGCQVAEVKAGNVICQCNHLTEFTIGVKDIPPPTPIDNGSGASRIGVIIGSTIGAIALVAIAVGAAVYVRGQRQKGQSNARQAAQDVDLEASTGEPQNQAAAAPSQAGSRQPPDQPPSYYANLYYTHSLTGAHIIKLGPSNDSAATEALQTWPNHLQIGGGITNLNALEWIQKGASHVIVTSWLFPDGIFSEERLKELSLLVGKDKLVVDVSCKRVNNSWVVAMNRWQTLTNFTLSASTIKLLESYCAELLVHAADVEGLCQGIDEELVVKLGEWCTLPVTYAGGGSCLEDLDIVKRLSKGKVDLTIGSALDIFGGSGVKFMDCVEWNRANG